MSTKGTPEVSRPTAVRTTVCPFAHSYVGGTGNVMRTFTVVPRKDLVPAYAFSALRLAVLTATPAASALGQLDFIERYAILLAGAFLAASIAVLQFLGIATSIEADEHILRIQRWHRSSIEPCHGQVIFFTASRPDREADGEAARDVLRDGGIPDSLRRATSLFHVERDSEKGPW